MRENKNNIYKSSSTRWISIRMSISMMNNNNSSNKNKRRRKLPRVRREQQVGSEK